MGKKTALNVNLLPVRSRYTKPFTSPEAQVKKLRGHGLSISDEDLAIKAIRRYGYYHLSGYTTALRDSANNSKDFRQGATFELSLLLYELDSQLRSVILEATSIIEIALRATIATSLGRENPFAHMLPQYCHPQKILWMSSSKKEILPSAHHSWAHKYSSLNSQLLNFSDYGKHFQRKYGPDLPIWVVTEGLHFGPLIMLYDLLPETDRTFIALQFGAITLDKQNSCVKGDPHLFKNWIECIRRIRNTAAHQGRIWNKNFDKVIKIPDDDIPYFKDFVDCFELNNSHRRSYGFLCLMRHLISHIDTQNTWYKEAYKILSDFFTIDSSLISPASLGMGASWKDHKIWDSTYEPAMQVNEQKIIVHALNDVGFISRPQIIKGLMYSCQKSEKEAKEYLRYLVRRSALIEFSVGIQKYYPRFQFQWDKQENVYVIQPHVYDKNVEYFKISHHTEENKRSLDVLNKWKASDESMIITSSFQM